MAGSAMPPVRHVSTNGITMGVYEAGAGVPVVFSHGFPELAFSWRHQIKALADNGFHAIAPDQRGFGATDTPPSPDAYHMGELTADMVGLLDALGLEKAIFCGHDWGGALVWAMAQFHPDRVAGVIALNTPHFPRTDQNPYELLRAARGDTMYMVTFQEPGVAEALLEKDVEATFRATMRRGRYSMDEFMALPAAVQAIPASVFLGDPDVMGEGFLSEDELAVYVEAYRRNGFRGPLNWYRNFKKNWDLGAGKSSRIEVPCLMIAAERDFFLPPSMIDGMEDWIPDLEKHVIAGSGHWTQQEKPEETNRLMLDWLKRRFGT